MENMSRMEVMKNEAMELSDSCKKEAMASLESPMKRRKEVKVTTWCGPNFVVHTSPTFWDHFSLQKIQIQKRTIGANLPCTHWTSIGLVSHGLTLSGLSNYTRPFTLSPWASRFEENQKAIKRKGMKREEEEHTKKKWWIPNPLQIPSKIR